MATAQQSTAERLRTYVRVAIEEGLTVTGYEIEGRKIRIETAPATDSDQNDTEDIFDKIDRRE